MIIYLWVELVSTPYKLLIRRIQLLRNSKRDAGLYFAAWTEITQPCLSGAVLQFRRPSELRCGLSRHQSVKAEILHLSRKPVLEDCLS